MRLNRHTRAHGIAMDMTPMIDVTFQLIIFFMTVSQMSVVENEILELPQLTGGLEQIKSTLTVNVTEDGRVLVTGEPLSVAELDQQIAQQLAANGGRPDLLTVILRVDRRGTCATTNQIMTRLKQRGVQRIRIAVEVPGPG